MLVKFTMNGEEVEWDVHPGETLFETIRREGFYGTKRGCNTGDCGTCTVHIDGEAVNSCQVFTGSVQDQEVKTIEGLVGRSKKTGELVIHPVQQQMVDKGGVQCGFCIPGTVMSAVALLEKNASPTIDDVKRALDGNLCRCTGYVKILEGIMAAAEQMRQSTEAVAQ